MHVAAWSSGMIGDSGSPGPGFDSRSGPVFWKNWPTLNSFSLNKLIEHCVKTFFFTLFYSEEATDVLISELNKLRLEKVKWDQERRRLEKKVSNLEDVDKTKYTALKWTFLNNLREDFTAH